MLTSTTAKVATLISAVGALGSWGFHTQRKKNYEAQWENHGFHKVQTEKNVHTSNMPAPTQPGLKVEVCFNTSVTKWEDAEGKVSLPYDKHFQAMPPN